MPAPYSYDLRVKVIKFVENKNNTITKASKLFGIARKTITEWKKIKETTGDIRAKAGYQKPHRRIIKEVDKFKELVEANNDKSAKELASMWHQKISTSAVVKFLKKLGYTYKKSLHSSQKGRWCQE